MGLILVLTILPACAAVIGVKDLIPGDESDGGGNGTDGSDTRTDGAPTNPDGNVDPGSDGGTDAPVDCGEATTSDHCGRCGHSCLGGGCEAGVCLPVPIATAQGNVGGVVVDTTHVYWTSLTNNVVARAPKSGGAVQVISQSPHVGLAPSLAVSPTHVYWGNDDFSNTVVNRCPLAGCGAGVPEKIADASRPVGIAVDGTHVYWCDRNTGQIDRRAFTGGAVQRVAQAEGSGPQALVVENGRAWWVGDFSGEVQSHFPDGGVFEVGMNGQSGRVVTVDAVNAYWGVQVDPGQLGKISRAPRNGGGSVQQIGVAGGEPLGMYLDGTTLYWTAQSPDGGAAGGGVYSCPTTGCVGAPNVVVPKQNLPRGIAVDDKAIYWGNQGSVMKLAKP